MDSILDDSVFDVPSAGSDFEDAPKPKAKAAPKAKKPAAPKATKAAPKKTMTQATLNGTKKPAPKKRAKPDSEDEEDISTNSIHDDTMLSNTPPSAKKVKKAPAKKAAGKPLAPLTNGAFDGAGDEHDDEPAPGPVVSGKQKSASDKYQKLTQLEHIIKRPDTYIGSIERNERQMWVYNTEKESMQLRDVSYVPGLYKIFDEILVNAADNKQNDKNMDQIKVTMNKETGEITVMNNGYGIPIQIHAKEQIYIPEMIFGHLLTGSNYDDDEQKVTGGRNGYGAKLCNIFSTKFTIETADSRSKQKYTQTWTNNMTQMGKAIIKPQKGGDDYTKVTFIPDFKYFKMDGIDDDFEALLKRRVYDLAGTVRGVKVYLNGERIKINNFKAYMEMYTKAIKEERGEEAASDASEIIVETDKERWEIGFAVSDGAFQQVSFVNSIATSFGGTHVNYVADQICNKLIEAVKKRKDKSGAQLKPAQIRNHIFLFVNAQIVNPAFMSQTKEQLTTRPSQFGSKFQVSDNFMKNVVSKTQVITNILAFAQQKADQILKKSDGNKRSRMDNPKLVDANKAGTKDGWKCTLILTEGDSAKGLAMTGRSIVGPDTFGVFPLRGKLLNVRDASIDQISKNAEIQNIKNIIGLKHKQVYEDCKSLRYGHIMIMTDQDHDGSHIKGLLINFLQVQYPSLLKIPEFLIEFITPIAKVIKGDPKKPTKSHMFFTMPEYEAWKEAHSGERDWEHKYYKGLGTSTDEDAEAYFRDIDRHLKEFHAMQESEPDLLELAFSKKKADERKEWLRQFKPGTFLDHTTKEITYTDFINKELILFSMADNMRSIPSVIDGFKPGQRKVLFAALKRNLRRDMKVVELAGFVMGVTAYHHGEASLQQTIVGMAQNFVGSNNVNVLEPSGNFGSRLQGGSDAASARYIFTRLSSFARKVFHSLDEPLLKHNIDDEKIIEPEMYVPVVPMVLINGADGIGTGWSSSIPNYNPEDIVANLKRMMQGEEPQPMTPWWRDYDGRIEAIATDRFKVTGIANQIGDHEVEIKELPIRVWTQDFKERIVEIMKGEKAPSWIKDYDDYNTKQKVNFLIRLDDKNMKSALEEGLEERFKLTKTIATSNLVAFDAQGRITKYANVEEILKAFYDVRIKFYEKRKAFQLEEMNMQLVKLTNQARFIEMIIDGKLVVSKKSKKVLVAELREKNFKPFPKIADATKDGEIEPALQDEDDDSEVQTAANAYDYLLGMAIWSLTKERVEKLRKQIGDKEHQINELLKLSKEDLWNKDLDEFLEEWHTSLRDAAETRKKIKNMKRRASGKLGGIGGAKPKKRKGGDSDDSDFETSKPKKAKKAAGDSDLMSGFLGKAKANAPKAVSKPKPVETVPQFDGTLDIVKKAPSQAVTIKAPAAKAEFSSDIDDPPVAARGGRAAAKKPVKYDLSDSEDEDDDFDIGKMVKGIGESTSGSGGRQLFTANSRPASSAGMKSLTAPRTSTAAFDVSFDADETNYHGLVPVKSPMKAPVPAGLESDDELGNSMDMDAAIPVGTKPAPRALQTAAALAAPAPKKGRPLAMPKKAVTKTAGRKASSTTKTSSKATATKVDSDDELDNVNQIANDILSDDDEIIPAVKSKSKATAKPKAASAKVKPAPKVKAKIVSDDEDEESEIRAARPARRAAAQTKKAWLVDEDDSDMVSDGFASDGNDDEDDD